MNRKNWSSGKLGDPEGTTRWEFTNCHKRTAGSYSGSQGVEPGFQERSQAWREHQYPTMISEGSFRSFNSKSTRKDSSFVILLGFWFFNSLQNGAIAEYRSDGNGGIVVIIFFVVSPSYKSSLGLIITHLLTRMFQLSPFKRNIPNFCSASLRLFTVLLIS